MTTAVATSTLGTRLLLTISKTRPGVPTTMCCPARSLSTSSLMAVPPMPQFQRHQVRCWYLLVGWLTWLSRAKQAHPNPHTHIIYTYLYLNSIYQHINLHACWHTCICLPDSWYTCFWGNSFTASKLIQVAHMCPDFQVVSQCQGNFVDLICKLLSLDMHVWYKYKYNKCK